MGLIYLVNSVKNFGWRFRLLPLPKVCFFRFYFYPLTLFVFQWFFHHMGILFCFIFHRPHSFWLFSCWLEYFHLFHDLQEDIYDLVASAGSEFSDWIQIVIDSKTSSFPWFSVACVGTIAHIDHLHLYQQIASAKLRQICSCCKRILKSAKIVDANFISFKI